MIEKKHQHFLLNSDFLLSYWLGPGGYTCWLYERNDEYFLAAIIGGTSYQMNHFPKDGTRQGESIQLVFSMLGFREWAIYCNVNQMAQEHKQRLSENFDILLKHFDQLEAEEKKKADAEKDKTGDPDKKPDLKLADKH